MATTRKPNPKELSPRDRVATVSHLIETAEYNSQHAYDHAKQAAVTARRIKKDDPNMKTVLHNTQHAVKHAKDTVDHVRKLKDHVMKTYPGAQSLYQELKNPKPSVVPTPPKNARK